MTIKTLSLSNVINVTIQGAAAALGIPNVNTAALFTVEDPSPAITGDYAVYKSPTEVLANFASSTETYKQAVAFFSQVPNVLGTGGYLVVIPLGSAEAVEVAIARTMDQVYYCGILVDQALLATPFDTLADYVQTLDKILFYGSTVAADIETGGMLDLLRTGSLTHTRGLYCTTSALDARLFAAAYAGRALSTNFSGVNTTQTMHLKALSGINADTGITQTVLTKCVAAGIDVYCSIAGLPAVFCSGENTFFDEIYNEIWFKIALQTAGFNFLKTTSTKIPQTEAGMDGLKNAYRAIFKQAVKNGFLAPGAWTSSDTFGDPEDLVRSVADSGYYIYSDPVAEQAVADRTARIAPLIQCAVKTAGAIHKSNITVNVNI